MEALPAPPPARVPRAAPAPGTALSGDTRPARTPRQVRTRLPEPRDLRVRRETRKGGQGRLGEHWHKHLGVVQAVEPVPPRWNALGPKLIEETLDKL